MAKKLDKNITTLDNFRHATYDLKGDTQMYVSVDNQFGDGSALIEITELEVVLPKSENDKSYLVLRAR